MGEQDKFKCGSGTDKVTDYNVQEGATQMETAKTSIKEIKRKSNLLSVFI